MGYLGQERTSRKTQRNLNIAWNLVNNNVFIFLNWNKNVLVTYDIIEVLHVTWDFFDICIGM